MPLSEEELRLLEQMERALAQEDPKFASTLQGRPFERVARWRALIAAVVFLGGVAILLGGAMAQMTWVGIVGFVVMLASATIGLTAWRGRHAPPPPARPDQAAPHEAHPASGQGHRFHVINGGRSQKRRPHRPRSRPRPGSGGGLVRRMEARWQRRRQQGF